MTPHSAAIRRRGVLITPILLVYFRRRDGAESFPIILRGSRETFFPMRGWPEALKSRRNGKWSCPASPAGP